MERNLIWILAGGLFLASCGGGGGGSDDDDDDGPPLFSSFVLDLIEETADDTDPESLEGLEFTFDEDPTAYDELFD